MQIPVRFRTLFRKEPSMTATTYPADWRRNVPATPLDLTQPITREQYIDTLNRVMYEIKRIVNSYHWCGSWWAVGGRLHPWFSQTPDPRDGNYGSVDVPANDPDDGIDTAWFTPDGLAAYQTRKGMEYSEQLRLLRGRILRCASEAYDTRQITAGNVNQILTQSGLGAYTEPTDTRAYVLYMPGVNVRTAETNDATYRQVVAEAWRTFLAAVSTSGHTDRMGEVEITRNRDGDHGIIPVDATEDYLPRR